MIALRPGALKRLRGDTSQSALARKADVARMTVRRIESGEAESVTFETINKLAKALGVDADMLVTFERER